MNLLTILTLLTTTAAPILALDIKTTHSTSCSRKTSAGDTVHMHYRGRLANSNDDAEFDSSYKRGRPLVFPVGRGVVIRGLVFFFLAPFLLPVILCAMLC